MKRRSLKMYVVLLTAMMIFCISPAYCGRDRVYFIAAIETLWDYAPSNVNQINGLPLKDDSNAAVFTSAGKERIGKVYKKVLYRKYKSIDFMEQEKHPEHLGLLGPVIKGEVGDKIIVYFKNMASRNYTMHAHGVFYLKSSEGALYSDSTTGNDKGDDQVPPGKIRQYIWDVTSDFSPTDGDSNCLTWLYHSHVNPIKDTNTGLIGTLLTCKKGYLDQQATRKDVNREFFLLFTVLDENKSWLLDDNLKRRNINPSKINKEDDDFKESNLMHGINGRIYGNLKGLDMCAGGNVSWHLTGLGNEVDIHTAYFSGNTVILDHHRTDIELLFPARSATGLMQALNPGKWMLSCQVADHYSAGMIALYDVKRCSNNPGKDKTITGKKRSYYIAAEEVQWNYGPSSMNLFDGGSLTAPGSKSATFFERSSSRIGGSYMKVLYREYTDASFNTSKLRRSPDEDYLGILGPVIHAEVGDEVLVTFKNKASYPFSIHPNGVLYDKANEGAMYRDGNNNTDSAIVSPGQTYTYRWFIPESVAPTKTDAPCISYFYSSSVNPIADKYSGLIGPLVICKRDALSLDGIPKGYKHERFLLFSIIDENKSRYLDKNMARFCKSPKCGNVDKEDEDFVESNKMHSINGYKYGNMPKLTLCSGEPVLWHVIGLGTETDMHTVYFQGNPIDDFGNHKDTVAVFPGSYATFRMYPDNLGKWPLLCRTNNHLLEGMKDFYTVKGCSKTAEFSSRATRTYYIGVVEREWDYAPTNKNLIRGYPLDEAGRGSRVFVHRGAKSIGKTYKKALYREFTDASFLTEKARGEDNKHLGILGPMIIAEEGDEIKVVLKNFASRNFSIHPHGLFYRKRDEASKYLDSNATFSPEVQPGRVRTYTWFVTKRASPGPKDSQCLTWTYYSSIDSVRDTNSGLVGPLITCRKGTLGQNGKRKDIDRAFTLFFTVLDENESWYLDENIAKYIRKNASISKTDDDFIESNKMHAINGYIYGNSKGFSMTENENINWYLIGLGGEVDMHTVHFHGHTFIRHTNSRHREDVYDLFPGIFATLEMKARGIGTWLLHCHVNDHIHGGMETLYTVQKESKKEPPTSSGEIAQYSALLILLCIAFFLFSHWNYE